MDPPSHRGAHFVNATEPSGTAAALALHPSLHGDDEPAYETTVTGQARPNVLFEAGIALGLQPERTVIIEIGRLRPIVEMAGLDVIRFDGTVESLNRIVSRITIAGCTPNTRGSDWLDVSRFKDLAAYTRRF